MIELLEQQKKLTVNQWKRLLRSLSDRLDMPMPDIDLGSLREVPWAPRRTVAPLSPLGKG